MKLFYLLLIFFSIFFLSCQNSDFYTLDDFDKVEKIDAHFHIYTENPASVKLADSDNFKLFCINTFLGDCQATVDAHKWLQSHFSEYPGEVEFSATFCLDGWDEPGWTEKTISWIDKCISDGAVAVKVWKNIGMEFRDKDSILVMIDDPQFDPVFQHLAERGIPLVGHLGEPKSCWMPLEEMNVLNNRNYFKNNPQYHMYLHPEYPSYEEQISARDRMLEKNPDLKFIACHLASLEWSVDEVADFLDRFPKSSVDLAARMGDLFYQTSQDRGKVRDFMIKYQDRILYATDFTDNGKVSEAALKNLHNTWIRDWEFLVTDNTMTSNLIESEFQGLKLPKEVVDKIFYGNVQKWYGIF